MQLKKKLGFVILTLTFIVMSAGHSFGSVPPSSSDKEGSVLNVEATAIKIGIPNHPLSHPHDTQVKASTSYSHLSSTFTLIRNQEVFCLFEILYEVKGVEEYHPKIPVSLHSFFLNLFSSIISPNAP